MLIPNHPDPERLSALASGDTDATADASLSGHVSTCVRCTAIVEELGALRLSLSELPDLRPHRPLRLLPEVADVPRAADRMGGWARRVFAPVLTAGAALAMVGLIGTTTPALDNLAAGGADSPESEEGLSVDRDQALDAAGSGLDEPRGAQLGGQEAYGSGDVIPLQTDGDRLSVDPEDSDDAERELLAQSTAERSPWPMVLFVGVAIMVAAGLLRWILAPRGP